MSYRFNSGGARIAVLSAGSLIGVAAALMAALAASAAYAGPPAGYSLSWSDEFNGPVGSLPNPNNWNFELGAGGWGNNELETYVEDTTHSSIISDPACTDGLALQIEATDDNSGLGSNGQYSSARLDTSGKVTPQYGYIEIRAKAPYGDGIWPAGWMLGSDYPDSGWPICGEQDIFEMFGQNSGTNMTSWHFYWDGGEQSWTAAYTLADGQLLAGGYHTYSILWTQQAVTAYVDGNEFETHGNADSPGWIFNHPFYFLLNMAVGGNPVGAPDSTTVFPQKFDIDYIRVYSASHASSPGYGTVTDPCADFSTVYNTSGNWLVDNGNLQSQTSDPSLFNGDQARIMRTTNGSEFVNYKYSNIRSATVTIGETGGDATRVTLWYSLNGGGSYTQALTTTSAITPTTGGWGTYTLSTSKPLPAGVTDLQIRIAPTPSYYDHEIMNVVVSSNSPTAAPQAPEWFTATAGDGAVLLNWDTAANATSYDLYRGTSPYSEFGAAPVATNIKASSFLDTGLADGTTYYYTLSAVDSAGTSAICTQESAGPQSGQAIPAPEAPANLLAYSQGGVNLLQWIASPGATTYNVYRGTSAGGESSTALVANLSATLYTDTAVVDGTTYYYTVTAAGGAGVSSASNEANAKPIATALPAPPSDLTATAGNEQIALSWKASSGATSYDVCRGTTSGGESPNPIATTKSTGYTNTGLTNGKTYYYVVKAVNSLGTSTASAQASAAPKLGPPPAPISLGAKPGNAEAVLTWAASLTATSYNIYRGTTSHGESAIAIGSTTSTSSTNTGLTNGKSYYYVVKAVNSAGKSVNSPEASATPMLTAPLAPSGLTATGGNEEVSLTWTASATTTSYNIYRGTTSDGESLTPVGSASTTKFVNTGLRNGTTYYFMVKAVNSAGTSKVSTQASATPELTKPAPPTNLAATPHSGQVVLNWTASATATSYNVYRGTVSNGESSTSVGSSSTTSYTNNGLTDGKTYYYVVKAVNSAGTSTNSNQASATP